MCVCECVCACKSICAHKYMFVAHLSDVCVHMHMKERASAHLCMYLYTRDLSRMCVHTHLSILSTQGQLYKHMYVCVYKYTVYMCLWTQV